MNYLKRLLLLFAVLSFAATSCEEVTDALDDQGLTEEEVVKGLKTALEVGTDTSSTVLSQTDGYYRDEVVKILLPPEADIIMEYKDNEYLQKIGIDSLINNAILSMNRAAENAAAKAQPIFVDAITGMSIDDGMNILQGSDTAATHYLRENTYDSLQVAYQPDVQAALDKDLVGNTSTQEAWDQLTGKYNEAANGVAGTLLDLEPVDTELKAYVTRKALDGLFVKVSKEEAQIREDPYQWGIDILHKVFGEEN